MGASGSRISSEACGSGNCGPSAANHLAAAMKTRQVWNTFGRSRSKRLRVHGLIKKVGHTYKYYLTRFGKAVITTGQSSGNWSSPNSPLTAPCNSEFLPVPRRTQM